MTDPMHDRCPALEPGTGERCVLYAKHVSDTTGVHVATGSWPVEPPPVTVEQAVGRMLASAVEEIKAALGVRSVEGSTPIASPAPRVGICGDSAPQIFPNTVPVVCSLPHGHAGWHHADGGGDWTERAPADEPAPVPPPVDALLDPMDELTRRLMIYGSACEDLGESGYQKHEPADIKVVADAVLDYARQSIADAFARGVAEGRRLLDETAATAAVHAYELGVAEGRRQAAHAITEETATFCMDGVGRHLVEVCTKLAAGKQADHG